MPLTRARTDAQHRIAQNRLDAQVGRQLGAILQAIPDPLTQAAFDTYAVAAAKTVAGGQRRSAELSFAYVGQLAKRPTAAATKPTRAPVVARALKGVLVTRDSPVARSPMLRIWGMAATGSPLESAIANAAAYAATLASNDLAVAERGGLDEAAAASGERIVGWRKDPDGDACDWCYAVAGDTLYGAAESVPFHANDRCGISPVFADEEPDEAQSDEIPF